MTKVLRILAIIIGVLALIDLYGAIFTHKDFQTYDIVGYQVSRMTYMIFKSLLAVVLLTAGIKGTRKQD